MDYHKYIVRNKKICGGVPVFKGTRVTLKSVLANLADGLCEQEILESYPSLKGEHLRAAIVFAATSAQEDIPYAGSLSIR